MGDKAPFVIGILALIFILFAWYILSEKEPPKKKRKRRGIWINTIDELWELEIGNKGKLVARKDYLFSYEYFTEGRKIDLTSPYDTGPRAIKSGIRRNFGKFRSSVRDAANKMKKIPDWYKVIQARGNAHAMLAKRIKVDDYEYWANAHKDEYMTRYNDGTLDVEGVKLRIEKFGYIASELEKVIKKAAELKLNATPEMHNEYHASRASVLAAEYALKEMSS